MCLRLDHAKLFEITRLRQVRKQAEWFKRHLGADVPYDDDGPILSEQAYQGLLAKRLGLIQQEMKTPEPEKPRPTVRMRGEKATT